MTCCPDTYAYEERIAVMVCEGIDEARAKELATAMYSERCHGCGQVLADEPA